MNLHLWVLISIIFATSTTFVQFMVLKLKNSAIYLFIFSKKVTKTNYKVRNVSFPSLLLTNGKDFFSEVEAC